MATWTTRTLTVDYPSGQSRRDEAVPANRQGAGAQFFSIATDDELPYVERDEEELDSVSSADDEWISSEFLRKANVRPSTDPDDPYDDIVNWKDINVPIWVAGPQSPTLTSVILSP